MKTRNFRTIAFGALFATGLSMSAPAFAQEDGPAGTWEGVLERNGARKQFAMQFNGASGIWTGKLRVDGASSPMTSVNVDGNHVRFEVPGQGVFDGAVSNGSLAGSISGSDPSGSFTATREQPEFPTSDPIYPQGP